MKVHLDFETFSEADLRKVGTWEYSKHPSTVVICMAWAIDDEKPKLWLPEHPFPTRLAAALRDVSSVIAAWSCFFEWCIWHHILQWDALPFERWEDTMAKAAVHNLPQSLAGCCEALDLPVELAKAKRGGYLINQLSKPQANGMRKRDRVLEKEMHAYCLQDVVAERTIDQKLSDLTPTEKKIWNLDLTMNIRGTYIDIDACNQALPILEKAKGTLRQEVYQVSEGELMSTNSAAKVLGWLKDRYDYEMESYTKADVKKALRDPELPHRAKQVLRIRQREGKSSTAKYSKLSQIVGTDNRAHGLLQHHAASTGRWGGRMFQPHNLPRPDIALKAYVDQIIDAFKYADPVVLELCFGEPMECLSTALRGMIIAPPGKLLYVGDYKQIEARALAWLAQQIDALAIYASGEDIYRHTAAILFSIPVDQVTDEQRFLGKIATLALGYQGGYRAFVKMAADFDQNFSEEFADGIKVKWRTDNHMIVNFWTSLEQAAAAAIRNKGTTYTVDAGLKNVQFHMGRQFLHLILPSGRHLFYYHAQIDDRGVRYMGMNSFTHQWQWIDMYGGKWAQNVCEGVCRDLLSMSMQNLEDNNFDMVLSVHDEAIAEAEPGRLTEFTEVMSRQPAWSHGLPVGVDSFASRRYRK